MRQTALALSIVFFVASVGMGTGCRPETSEEDASEDTWTAGDTSSDTDEASDSGPVDSEVDGGPIDSGPEDGETDNGDDTGIDTGIDTGVEDTWVNPDVLPTSFGAGSFLHEYYIDKQTPSKPRCCFDIDGTTGPDNSFANLLSDVGTLLELGITDVNQTLNNEIQNGNLVYLFEYFDWSQSMWKNDSMITMYAHSGQDAQSPFSDNLNGTGTFEILTESYDKNGNPRSEFNTASSSSGDLTAEDGTLVLPFDFGDGIVFDLHIKRPKVTATVDSSADVSKGGTVPLSNGKMGGAIPKADLYNGLNAGTSNCSCLGGKKLFVPDPSATDKYKCNSPSSGCSCQNSDFINSCTTIRDQIDSYDDIDTNSNGEPDALSFGASFTAVGAEIVGVAPQ